MSTTPIDTGNLEDNLYIGQFEVVLDDIEIGNFWSGVIGNRINELAEVHRSHPKDIEKLFYLASHGPSRPFKIQAITERPTFFEVSLTSHDIGLMSVESLGYFFGEVQSNDQVVRDAIKSYIGDKGTHDPILLSMANDSFDYQQIPYMNWAVVTVNNSKLDVTVVAFDASLDSDTNNAMLDKILDMIPTYEVNTD